MPCTDMGKIIEILIEKSITMFKMVGFVQNIYKSVDIVFAELFIINNWLVKE